ncbi:MAG: type II toxin-antitoxin system HicA family toxin [Brevinematales bacterium]|nr:type II toxin-antitoxin system HicA family toxin [Brevinematales bacterium]
MPKRLNAREIEVFLKKGGFELISQEGSHRKWMNRSTGRMVIVPIHKRKELPIGTMMSIIKGSGLGKEFFGL